MIEIATWILAAISVVGVVLNIYKIKWCFYFWAFTNLFWMVYDYSIGATAQGTLMGIYFCLSIWGIIQWSRENRAERHDGRLR